MGYGAHRERTTTPFLYKSRDELVSVGLATRYSDPHLDSQRDFAQSPVHPDQNLAQFTGRVEQRTSSSLAKYEVDRAALSPRVSPMSRV